MSSKCQSRSTREAPAQKRRDTAHWGLRLCLSRSSIWRKNQDGALRKPPLGSQASETAQGHSTARRDQKPRVHLQCTQRRRLTLQRPSALSPRDQTCAHPVLPTGQSTAEGTHRRQSSGSRSPPRLLPALPLPGPLRCASTEALGTGQAPGPLQQRDLHTESNSGRPQHDSQAHSRRQPDVCERAVVTSEPETGEGAPSTAPRRVLGHLSTW